MSLEYSEPSPEMRDPENPFKAKDFLTSAQLSEEIFESTRDTILGFNTACLYAEAKQPIKALALLAKSIDAGYLDLEKMEYQPELRSVRALPGWAPLKIQAEAANRRLEAQIEHPKIRQGLLSMWVQDQRVQRAWNAVSSSTFWSWRWYEAAAS